MERKARGQVTEGSDPHEPQIEEQTWREQQAEETENWGRKGAKDKASKL